MPPSASVTIFQWAQTWDAPDYNSRKQAPHPPARHADVGKNTSTVSNKTVDIQMGILEWDISMDNIRELAKILDSPYDWDAYGKEFRPMREFFPDVFPSPFDKEAVLASRLITTFFNDLSRCQNYIIARRERLPTWYPSDYVPTFTEVGTTCLQTETWSSSHPPIPDRATIGSEDTPLLVTKRPSTRLPGDIKCSHKFQASWRRYADPYRTKEQNKTEGTGAMQKEYQKVMAQINHYMEYVGGVNFEEAGRYGYIITDEEAILVQRAAISVHGAPEGNRIQLYASRGFPLRRKETGPVPDDYISGMLALLWIHLVVGCQDPGKSYAMARPGFVNLDE